MYDVIHAWFSSLASTTVHRYENDTGIFYLLYILVANIPVYTQKTIDAPHLNGGRPHLPSLHHWYWYSNQLWYLYYLYYPVPVPGTIGSGQIHERIDQ